MFCTKCGKPLRGDERFCTGCGAPTSQGAAKPSAPAKMAAPAPAPKASAKPRKKSRGPIVALAVAILLLVAAIVGGILIWRSRVDLEYKNPAAASTEAVETDGTGAGGADQTGEPSEAPSAAPAYDFAQMAGAYYCAQTPNASLDLSVAGDKMSILKVTDGGVDIQTVIDPPSGPNFSIDYGGRIISFFYSNSSRSVTVTEGSATQIYTEDGALAWAAETAAPAADPFHDPDGYILPTDTRYITESELYPYTAEQVALIRNEIYARHGYSFTKDQYKTYFGGKSWYRADPNVNANTFGTGQLNDYERTNVDTIKSYENAMGW